jgi:hypothetical protein
MPTCSHPETQTACEEIQSRRTLLGQQGGQRSPGPSLGLGGETRTPCLTRLLRSRRVPVEGRQQSRALRRTRAPVPRGPWGTGHSGSACPTCRNTWLRGPTPRNRLLAKHSSEKLQVKFKQAQDCPFYRHLTGNSLCFMDAIASVLILPVRIPTSKRSFPTSDTSRPPVTNLSKRRHRAKRGDNSAGIG